MGSRFPYSICPKAKSINCVTSLLTIIPHSLLVIFPFLSRYSVVFSSLPPQGSPTMSSANIMDSGSYFLTPSVSMPRLVQSTVHVKYVAFASCDSRTLVSQSRYNVLYQFNILFWYIALARAYPDLVPRYPIVCLWM